MEQKKNKRKKNHSLISDIRKEQIIEATISVIGETGYSNASLANIAKKADVSTALISYYFPSKKDLADLLLKELIKRKITYIGKQMKEVDAPTEKLFAYIHANLSYSINHPSEGAAITELVFNAKDKNKELYYQSESDDSYLLEEIIKMIQMNGGFPNLNAKSLSIMIKGAVKEYAIQQTLEKIDQKTYDKELISIISRLTGFSKKYTIEPLKK